MIEEKVFLMSIHPLPRLACPALLAATMVACTPTEYAFVPASSAMSAVSGHEAADYPIAAATGGAPQGDLRIASNGIAQLSRQDAAQDSSGDETVSALHLRLVVTNSSTHPWSLDTRAQRLAMTDHGTSAPAFASASSPGAKPPVVTIAPRTSRSIDLYFPLPADMHEPADVPAFTATWQLDTGGALLTQPTSFERVAVDETGDDNANGYGDEYAYLGGPYYGPYWYNPAYFGFYGTGFVGTRYVGHSIVIRGWGGPYYGGYRGGGYYGGGYRGGGFHGGGFHGGGHAGHGGGHR